MDKTGLILFSHGSLLCGAGETLRAHAERLRAQGRYCTVEVGYLNYSKPIFEDAVDRCLTAGARRIVIVPYFLVSGKFVTSDLPPRIEAARAQHPGLEFRLADAVLYHMNMADAILDLAETARPPERWRDDLLNAKKFCEARETCPLFGTEDCPASATPARGKAPAVPGRAS